MKYRTMLVAIGIVVALVFGYWAVIGFKNPIPDFVNTWINGGPSNGGGDGSGGGHVNYTGYATFVVTFEITSCAGPDGTGLPMHPATGNITKFTYKVDKYVSPDQGKVYENLPLLKHVTPPASNWGGYWINITVSGPGGFASYWQSPTGIVIYRSSTDPQMGEMSTGRCLFGENGQDRKSVV
jgi:hypothetical protein